MSQKTDTAIAATRTLEDCESIIATALPHAEAAALALLEIHENRLYRQGYNSFEEYVQQRWHLSRSRAYQLVRFARLRRQNPAHDAARPQNERQARKLAAAGTARAKQRTAASISNAVKYVVSAFHRRPQDERRQFIVQLRQALLSLEKQLELEFPTSVSSPSPPIITNHPNIAVDETQLIVESELPPAERAALAARR